MNKDLVGSTELTRASARRLLRSGARASRVVMALAASATVSGGCSGGGGDTSVDASTPVDASRVAAVAAAATAETNASCLAVAPFYWEIGDASGTLISGSVGSAAPVASTVMSVASASKWLFGAYAIQKMGGIADAMYVPFLNLTSGYVGLNVCPPAGTIGDCLVGAAETPIAADIGKFAYDGAHLQKLASLMGLGAEDNAGLATEVTSQVGAEISFEYTEPQPAAGVKISADQYVLFLRKLLVGSPTPLLMGSVLGRDAVCTNPVTCPSAVFSPIPSSANPTDSWHYGLAHWIEDDPTMGDGAFSSPGGFGFYPWVDATRTIYGVLAREAPFTGHAGYDSVLCGRLIRKAWVAGVVQ